MAKTIDQTARPVIFGELLYDHYPNGEKFLGGAPLNVAWHLQGFGLRPILVTRLGQDTEGELALTEMIRWGMDTRAVQIDPEHQTGSVLVRQSETDNQFEIKPDQAWDFISSALVLEWLKHLPCSLIYAGSLAQRSPFSRKTLQRIILEIKLPVFIDINLRPPWDDVEIINSCLESAHWLKLNNHEIECFAEKTLNSDEDLKRAALNLKTTHDIGDVYITHGEQGAMLINASGVKQLAGEVITAIDTIGAGDAFSAVVILGLHLGWSDFQIIKNANEFSARICQGQGGTPLKKKDYKDLLKQWL